jgi:hypothetical protein
MKKNNVPTLKTLNEVQQWGEKFYKNDLYKFDAKKWIEEQIADNKGYYGGGLEISISKNTSKTGKEIAYVAEDVVSSVLSIEAD